MPVDVQIAVDHDPSKTTTENLRATLEQWSERVITEVAGEAADPDVCVRLVGEEESRALNLRFRGRDKPTNVLSFPAELDGGMLGDDPGGETGFDLLGDVVICAPVVQREAGEQGKSFDDHLGHMVVHGLLHLYGYDHERDEASRLEMETMERELLGRFGVGDPYREL